VIQRVTVNVTLFLTVLVGIGQPMTASGFEPTPTHPGLTAPAMLASKLHTALRSWGWQLGLFETLRLDPGELSRRDFNRLRRDLLRLDPAGGYAPNAEQRLRAAGWTMAGSVLAQRPASLNRNHFYCPALRAGLDDPVPFVGTLLGLLAVIDGADTVRELFTGTGFDLTGKPAPEWVLSGDSPWSVNTFHQALATSVSAPTLRKRQHHLAMALLSLGAVLHVLQDMASPTHVRNDFRVGHLQQLGSTFLNRGSVFERYVSRRFGQFGIPRYRGKPIQRNRTRDFFTNKSWSGLADITTVHHFSPGTVPPPIQVLHDADPDELRRRLQGKLQLAKPALGPIDFACLRRQARCHIKGPHGPQLAFSIDRDHRLSFFLDGRCHFAAARHLLPLAIGFSTGLINHLIRARIALKDNSEGLELLNNGVAISSGRARIFVEDKGGNRRPLQTIKLGLPAEPGASLARFRPILPASAHALVVLLVGQDRLGEPLVAATRHVLTGNTGKTDEPSSGPGKDDADDADDVDE